MHTIVEILVFIRSWFLLCQVGTAEVMSLPSGLPSFPLKSLVADSNNKLQSDQSIADQLEPFKSLRMRGWGKNQFAIYIRLMSVENTEKETAPRIQV